MKNKYSKRIDEPTPNGGAYSIAYFLDKDKIPCAEDKAKFIEIVEYDKENTPICRSYCVSD